VSSVASGRAVPERRQVSMPVRKAALVVAFIAVFLTVGVPRWLAHDAAPTGAHTAADFASLCRAHGGTPQGSTGAEPFCTVRYGGTVYRMDAITPNGFDRDTAAFQRQGCEQAASEGRALHGGRTFVYHSDTGVCEHRP
jgi:hypothetical protein